MKTCIRCDKTKEITEFHKHKQMKDGHLNKCRVCVVECVSEWRKKNPEARKREWERSDRYKNRKYGPNNPNWTDEDRIAARKAIATEYAHKRRIQIEGVTPKWSDKDTITGIFKLAARRGLHVDHMVPLNHPEVCGLHTEDNLRCIPRNLNEKKGNRYWPDMWDTMKAKQILTGY